MNLNTNPRTLPEARTELETGQAEITRLETDLETEKGKTANVDVVKLQADLVAMTSAKDTAEKKVADIEPKLEAATGTIAALEKTNKEQAEKIENFDKTVEDKSKEKAIELLAAKGLSPLQLGVDEQGEKKTTNLKGVQRTGAAFNEELKDHPRAKGNKK